MGPGTHKDKESTRTGRFVSGDALGAYGFRIQGAFGAAHLLSEMAPEAPLLAVSQHVDDTVAPADASIGTDHATLALLPSGWLEVDRHRSSAVYHVPVPIGMEALIHPYLAPAAAVAALWQGWDPYHAAGVLIDGGVWAVSGAREVGKSTLIAALAALGYVVMADDLIVVRDGEVMAGPRTIDLRGSAGDRFGATRELGVAGMRERWRIDLPAAPPSAPLRGWIYPEWGDSTSIEPLTLAERLGRPQEQRAATLEQPSPEHAMWLARLPAMGFRRRRSWDDLDTSLDVLLGAINAGAQSATSSE